MMCAGMTSAGLRQTVMMSGHARSPSQLLGVALAGGDERSCQNGWALDVTDQLLLHCFGSSCGWCSLVAGSRGYKAQLQCRKCSRVWHISLVGVPHSPGLRGPLTAVATALAEADHRVRGCSAVQSKCSICCQACMSCALCGHCWRNSSPVYVYMYMCVDTGSKCVLLGCAGAVHQYPETASNHES
jgi:hypothetical protein